MKINKKHIFNLLASLLCLLSVSAKTNDSKDVAKHLASTKTTEIAKATSDKLAVFDLVEEVTVSHFSQDNSEDYTNFQVFQLSNTTAYLPYKYLHKKYTQAAYSFLSNKQQLLLLIFPFHYFY